MSVISYLFTSFNICFVPSDRGIREGVKYSNRNASPNPPVSKVVGKSELMNNRRKGIVINGIIILGGTFFMLPIKFNILPIINE